MFKCMTYNVKKQAACYLLVLLHEGYLILPSSQSMYHKHKCACWKPVFIIIFFWHYQTGLSSHKRGVTPPSSETLSSELYPSRVKSFDQGNADQETQIPKGSLGLLPLWPPVSHMPGSLQQHFTIFTSEHFQSEMKSLKDYIHKTLIFFPLTFLKILTWRIHYLAFRLYSLVITKSTRTNHHWYENSICATRQYWKIQVSCSTDWASQVPLNCWKIIILFKNYTVKKLVHMCACMGKCKSNYLVITNL